MGEEETESEECKRALLKQTLSGGKGFPGGLDSKESACNAGDPGPIPGLGRSSGEENGTSIFLPEESLGQRSLVGYSPWGCKELGTNIFHN